MKNIPVCEQETTVQFDRDGDYARIWTSDSTVITKLDKAAKDNNSPWEITDFETNDTGDVIAREYRVPKYMVSFRKTDKRGKMQRSNDSEDN